MDDKGNSCIKIYEVGDQVLLNSKNLSTNVVSAVFKTKLRPRFIRPFTVVDNKGFAYILNLPQKLRTHPVFYVGLLKPYRNSSQVDREALTPRKSALPYVAASESGDQLAPTSVSESSHTSTDGLAPRLACAGSDPKS